MAAWMAYAVVVSTLLLAAAWAAERALRMYRSPTRIPWAAAFVGATGVPAAAWAAPGLLPGLFPSLGAGLGSSSPVPDDPVSAAAVVMERLEVLAGSAGLDLDLFLVAAWALATSVLIVRLLWARRELGSTLSSASSREMGGVRVLLTSDLGPAVTGLRTGQVVLPRWLWRLGAEQRRLAVAHEREHLRAGDPWLLAGARLLATLMPWNLPLWWGLRRLRLAVETDCDRRVLQRGADPRSYGTLLLRVGERCAPVRGLAALAERTSFLERRIDQMTRATTKWRGPKAFLACAVAIAALAVACESPTPTEDGTTATGETSPPAATSEATTTDRPKFVPYDEPPRIANVNEVREALQAAYPADLKQGGVDGRVVLWIFVNSEGRVENVKVQAGSDHTGFDVAAIEVARSMEFEPARHEGEPTGVWVQQPITFETK